MSTASTAPISISARCVAAPPRGRCVEQRDVPPRAPEYLVAELMDELARIAAPSASRSTHTSSTNAEREVRPCRGAPPPSRAPSAAVSAGRAAQNADACAPRAARREICPWPLQAHWPGSANSRPASGMPRAPRRRPSSTSQGTPSVPRKEAGPSAMTTTPLVNPTSNATAKGEPNRRPRRNGTPSTPADPARVGRGATRARPQAPASNARPGRCHTVIGREAEDEPHLEEAAGDHGRSRHLDDLLAKASWESPGKVGDRMHAADQCVVLVRADTSTAAAVGRVCDHPVTAPCRVAAICGGAPRGGSLVRDPRGQPPLPGETRPPSSRS